MTLKEFVDKYNGKLVDYDSFYGAQCSDLAQQYNKEMYGGPFLTGEAAADLWETYPVDYYERVLNTPDAVPTPGDMMIWKKTTSLPWGHVGICVEGDLNRFKSFDQNWPTGAPCSLVEHNYTGVIGFLRPIKSPLNDIDYKTLYEETLTKLNEKTQLETFLRGEIQKKDDTINNLNNIISGLESEKNRLADELRVCELNSQVNAELNNKIIQLTQELNQLKLDYEQSKSNWQISEVAYQKQLALLTTKYAATKSSIKKLLIDYIFGKS